ncbi:hypothetical protein D3C86_1301050 [compost metagenome]
MLDLRQVRHELAVAVVDAVTTLGDGQRDNPDLRIGEFVDQRLGAVLGQQHVANGANDADFGVVGITQFEQGEQVILFFEVITGATVFRAQADAANRPVQAFAGVHQRVGVIRLMRAVETADADVGDALARIAQGVGGQDHLRGEAVEVLFIEFHHKLSGIRRQRAVGGSAPRRRHRINGSVRRPGAGSGFRHNGSPGHRVRAWSGLHRKRFERGRKCRCPGVR